MWVPSGVLGNSHLYDSFNSYASPAGWHLGRGTAAASPVSSCLGSHSIGAKLPMKDHISQPAPAGWAHSQVCLMQALPFLQRSFHQEDKDDTLGNHREIHTF